MRKLSIHFFIWLRSNGSFRDETITSSQIGRQFPAQALRNPFGYGLLSPLIMAPNHVLSHWETVIALCLLSGGRHLTYLSVILSPRRGCDQCAACCCSPKQPAQQRPTQAKRDVRMRKHKPADDKRQIYLICGGTHYWEGLHEDRPWPTAIC